MVTRTQRAALRDRAPVTNTPAQSTSRTRGRVKGKVKDTSAKVSKKRKSTPPPPDAEVEDAPPVDDGPTQNHGGTEKSQEGFSIGGFSFEDSQQSGVGLPGLDESVILQSTPAPSWRRKRKVTPPAHPQSSRPSTSIMKQPAGLKASSPLPPSSPIPTSPFPSSRPVGREPEPEHELVVVDDTPSEHPSDDPFGFLSAERKLRAKKGEPKRRDKGKAVDRSPAPPETVTEPEDDDHGIEDLYASEGDAPAPQGYQTPPPHQLAPLSERSSSLTSLQSPHTPSTPNKRSSNKRKLARSRDSSPEPSAAPTSPSPSKPRVRSGPSPDAKGAGATTRGRTRKKRKSEETKEGDVPYDEMDPSQIEEHLEALLPKPSSKTKRRVQVREKGTRQSARKTTRRAKAPTPSSSEDESEPSPPRRPTSKRGGKKPASRTGRAKKDVDEEEDVDLDELEVSSFFLKFTTFPGLMLAWFTESAPRTARVLQEAGKLSTVQGECLCRMNVCAHVVPLVVIFWAEFFFRFLMSASLCCVTFAIGYLLYRAVSRSAHRRTVLDLPGRDAVKTDPNPVPLAADRG